MISSSSSSSVQRHQLKSCRVCVFVYESSYEPQWVMPDSTGHAAFDAQSFNSPERWAGRSFLGDAWEAMRIRRDGWGMLRVCAGHLRQSRTTQLTLMGAWPLLPHTHAHVQSRKHSQLAARRRSEHVHACNDAVRLLSLRPHSPAQPLGLNISH